MKFYEISSFYLAMPGGAQAQSANFEFLEKCNAQLYRLAALAERYLQTDPNTGLMKLRQFAETMAREVAARAGRLPQRDAEFLVVLRAIGGAGYAPATPLKLFHCLRKHGNDAVHHGLDDFDVAVDCLRVARELAGWYARSYGGQVRLTLGPFTPPPSPASSTAEARLQLERLRAEARAFEAAVEAVRNRAEALVEAARTVQQLAPRDAAATREVWRRLAEEIERVKSGAVARLDMLLPVAEQASVEAPAGGARFAKRVEYEAADRGVWLRLAEEVERDEYEAEARLKMLQREAEAAPGQLLTELEHAAETAAGQISLGEVTLALDQP